MPSQQLPLLDAPWPAPGDRVLLLKKQWLDMILRGEKVVEVRGQRLKPGPAWLACGPYVYAIVEFDAAQKALDLATFQQRWPEHRLVAAQLQYARTWLWPIQSFPPCRGLSLAERDRARSRGTSSPLDPALSCLERMTCSLQLCFFGVFLR